MHLMFIGRYRWITQQNKMADTLEW